MMLSRLILPLSLLGLLVGCTTTQPAVQRRMVDDDPYAAINRSTHDKTVTVELRDAEGRPTAPVRARSFTVAADSARWLDPDTGARRALPTASLHSVTAPRRLQGTIGGAMLGGGLGILSGLLIISTVYNGQGDAFFLLVTGAAGAVTGTVIGTIIGSKVRYTFEPPTQR